MQIRSEALALIMSCPLTRAVRFAEPLRSAMVRHGIDEGTDEERLLRMSHFLAQVGHESGRLRYTLELWGPTTQQRKYDPVSGSKLSRMLGNEDYGDGFRFRGRGLIQLTGRSNYEQYAADSGLDVVAEPDRLSEPYWAADVAAWYWRTRQLNRWADQDNARQVTRRINGGYNGLTDRLKLLARAKSVLAVEFELERRRMQELAEAELALARAKTSRAPAQPPTPLPHRLQA